MKMINKLWLLTATILLVLTGCGSDFTSEGYETSVYNKLESVLKKTEDNLTNYLNHTQKLAQSIPEDELMASFFLAKRDYYDLQKNMEIPENLVVRIENLKKKIQHHYLMNYLNFYDILFIDLNGDIFYTIRKQGDYHKNIFKGKLSTTNLSKKLKEKPNESYVDFQFYDISGEPSAFFIEPLKSNGEIEGWFVMQCTIDKINMLFDIDENLGKTGEVLLVNKEHYLLTNSRFKVQPTVLKQKLPEKNIETKFKERKGRKEVFDYRQKSVMSVFDVHDFLNNEWLIIAKIDKDEVYSDYYMKHQKFLQSKLNKGIENSKNTTSTYSEPDSLIEVHMDEYKRADKNERLFTQGVFTCTAISINYSGKFAYLAHISPYDQIYNNTKTDLLGQLLKQISYFEITESEKRNVEFHIVSAQINSFERCIEKILQNNYFLSQIKISYNSKAEYSNIYHDVETQMTYVNWKEAEGEMKFSGQNFQDIDNLNTLLFKY